MTSLAFMFVEVPEPVWKMSTTNWSSQRPSATSAAARATASAMRGSRSPSSAFTSAAHGLDQAEDLDEAPREAQAADGEVEDGTHGGGAVVGVQRHFHRAHGIAFGAGVGRIAHVPLLSHTTLPAAGALQPVAGSIEQVGVLRRRLLQQLSLVAGEAGQARLDAAQPAGLHRRRGAACLAPRPHGSAPRPSGRRRCSAGSRRGRRRWPWRWPRRPGGDDQRLGAVVLVGVHQQVTQPALLAAAQGFVHQAAVVDQGLGEGLGSAAGEESNVLHRLVAPEVAGGGGDVAQGAEVSAGGRSCPPWRWCGR